MEDRTGRATKEPSISSRGQLTQRAKGKHMCTLNTNDITLGMPEVTCINEHVFGNPLPPPIPNVTNDQDQADDHPSLVGGDSDGGLIMCSQDRSEDKPGPQSGNVRDCTYLRGGVCRVHGPGARRCWRPIRRPDPSTHPPGKVVKWKGSVIYGDLDSNLWSRGSLLVHYLLITC